MASMPLLLLTCDAAPGQPEHSGQCLLWQYSMREWGFLHGSLVAQEAGLIWCHNPRMQDLLRPSTIWREGVAPFFLV